MIDDYYVRIMDPNSTLNRLAKERLAKFEPRPKKSAYKMVLKALINGGRR